MPSWRSLGRRAMQRLSATAGSGASSAEASSPVRARRVLGDLVGAGQMHGAPSSADRRRPPTRGGRARRRAQPAAASGGHLVGSAAVTEPASSIPSAEDRPGLARGRYVPALLTVLVPGLGHLVAGRLRLAALFGLPLVFLAALAVGVLAATTTDQLVGALLDDRVLVLVLVLEAALLGWRLLALGSSLTDRRLPRLRMRDTLPVIALVILVAAPQAYAGVVSQAVRESANDVFVEDAASSGAWQPAADADPDAHREPRHGCHVRPDADPLPDADRDTGGRPDQRADPGRRRRRRSQHVPDRHDDRGVAGPRCPDGLAPLLPPRPGGRPAARRRRLLRQGQLPARVRAPEPGGVPGLQRRRPRRPDGGVRAR